MNEKIKFYNSLDLTLSEAENIFSNAVDDSKSLFHTPTLSTFINKKISSRTVVLREFNKEQRFLRFHTDSRSNKINQIINQPSSAIHGYDPSLKIQIRLNGQIKIHQNDEISKNAWNQSREMSKICYSVSSSPGKEIIAPEGYDIIKEEIKIEDGYKNFAVILFKFDYLEFLFLKGAGHRRSSFDWSNGDLISNWLIP